MIGSTALLSSSGDTKRTPHSTIRLLAHLSICISRRYRMTRQEQRVEDNCGRMFRVARYLQVESDVLYRIESFSCLDRIVTQTIVMITFMVFHPCSTDLVLRHLETSPYPCTRFLIMVIAVMSSALVYSNVRSGSTCAHSPSNGPFCHNAN